MNGSGHQRWGFSTELSVETLKKIVRYDPETGIFYWIKGGQVATRRRGCSYNYVCFGSSMYPAHTLAWFYMTGKWCLVDHKDRNKQNNAFLNLRETTHQLNAANRTVQLNNSGAKGVYKRGNLYEVGIKIDGRRIYLGRYKTRDEASQAYKDAAVELFGEFANAE